MNEWKVRTEMKFKKKLEGLHFNFLFFGCYHSLHAGGWSCYCIHNILPVHPLLVVHMISHLTNMQRWWLLFLFYFLLVEWVTARWHINDTLLILAYNPTVILPTLKFFTNALVHFKIYNKIYNIIYIYNLNTIDSHFYILLTL